MKRIIYIHSNICSITIHRLITEFERKSENVLIITGRGTDWPYRQNSEKTKIVKIEDISDMDVLSIITISSVRELFTASKKYSLIKKIANSVIGDEKFVLYVPHLKIPFFQALSRHTLCKGYYFIEEGTMSYLSPNRLKQIFHYSLSKKIILFLCGIYYDYPYSINNNFKGTIAISDYAFIWNHKNKLLTSVDIDIKTSSSLYYEKMHIVILSHINYNSFEQTFELLKRVCIYLKTKTPFIYVKPHPSSDSSEKNLLETIRLRIKKDIPELKVIILPNNFVVEINLILAHSYIYSLSMASSLLLYAILLGGKSYIMGNEGLAPIELTTVDSVLERV